MSDTETRTAHAAERIAFAPETLAVFVVLALAWVAGFSGVLPNEVWVVDAPALAVAFFLDTLAFNEFGVTQNTVFYPALAVCIYLEAMVLAVVIRLVRRRLGRVSVGE